MDRLDYCLLARFGIEFAADVAEVKVHSSLGTIQQITDLPRAFSDRAPLEALQFAVCDVNMFFCLARMPDELQRTFKDKIAKARQLGNMMNGLALKVLARLCFAHEAH